MKIVNIHETKTHLSKLVDAAAKGEAFIIAKAGKPMVRVLPMEEPEVDTSKRFGFMRGEKMILPDNFDRWAEDEIREMFERTE